MATRKATLQYSDLATLRDDVVDAVRLEVAKKLRRDLSTEEGRRLFQADVDHIVDRVGSAEFWAACAAARRAYEPVAELAQASRVVADWRLGRVAELAHELLKEFEGVSMPDPKVSARSIIADPLVFGARDLWWTDGPTPRDRALVSILAGNMPSLDRNMTAQQAISKEANTFSLGTRRIAARSHARRRRV